MSRAYRQCLGALGSAAILLATPFGAKAQYKNTYSFGTLTTVAPGNIAPVVVYPGSGPGTVEQAAVNHNIGSPYYGYAYVADEAVHVVFIYKPTVSATGTAATSYTNTGFTIKVPGAAPSLAPFGVAIGSDDTVWLGDSNANQVESAPPVPTSGLTVTATVQFSTAASGPGVTPTNPFIRAMTVVGPVTNAKVYLGEGNVPDVLQLWSGAAVDANTPGVFTKTYSTDVNAGNGIVQGPYGIAVDPAGNAYIANKGTATGSLILKFSPTGAYDSTYTAPIPTGFATTSNLAAVSFVPDPTYSGGGYLAYSSYVTTPAGNIGLAYDLAGNYLFGWGPALTAPAVAPPNYTVLPAVSRSTSTPAYLDVDTQGDYYERTVNLGNSSVGKIFKTAPYVLANAGGTAAAIHSSPAGYNNVTYFGADDGYLYAIKNADGTAQFPAFNARANGAGATAKILGRPSIRAIGDSGAAHVYFATDDGTIFSLNAATGALDWAHTVSGAANVSTTPAEYNNGSGEFVYAVESVSGAAEVLKLDAATGASVLTSSVNIGVAAKSSPSVFGNDIIVGTDAGIFRIQTTDLTVLTTIAADATSTSPFIGVDAVLALPTALIVSDAGNVYSRQLDTGTPTLLAPVSLGTTVSGSPFERGGVLYVGGTNGKVYAVNATTGLGAGPAGSLTFFDANADVVPAGSTAVATPGTAQITSGVAIDTNTSTLVFGTVEPGTNPGGKLFQVSLSNPASFNVQWSDSPINTVATINPTNGVLAGNDSGKLMKFTSR